MNINYLKRKLVLSFGILNASIKNCLQYRLAFFSATISTAFTVFAYIMFWSGLYYLEGSKSIIGLERAHMVSYVFFAQIVSRLIHASDTIWSYSNDIRNGKLNAYLLQPLNYRSYRLFNLLGGRLVDIIISILPFILAFLIIKKDIYFSWTGIIISIPILMMSLLLYFYIDCFIGTLAFWLENVSGISYFKWVLFSFLGGAYFPITLFPEWGQKIVQLTPISYLIYYPAQIMSGNILYYSDVFKIFSVILIWIAVFSTAEKVIWKKGLKRYSAYGG